MPELEPREGPAVARARDSLGHALKKLLQRERHSGRSIKVPKLAKDLSISRASLYAYLAGDTLPPTDKLDDLLTKLEVPPSQGRWFHELRDDIELRFQGKADVVDSGPPLIEITLPDGAVEVADIEDGADVPAELKSLSGPYVIEQLSEHVHVNAQRTIPRVDCRRRIRALTAGVRRFSYAFEGPPDSGLSRVVIESHDEAVVSHVIRVGQSSYIVHMDLPEPLDARQTGDISWSLLTFENPSNDAQDVYGNRQFVDTERVDLTVEFPEEGVPAQVRWFAADFEIGNFPAGFNFPKENVIEAGPGRRYEWTFSRTGLPQGRIVGMVWDY